ncbi:MAG TPA: hypothetical protein ENK77_03115 [Epsilonproteobacteria bacterium]|nr:hypothetical protein [Campylobacterota bacterium]
MGIEENVNYVKKELSGDEKVLESALKIETLYKKHKRKVWAVLVLFVLFFGGKAIISAVHESKLERANEALLLLQKDPQNSEALETLRSKNPTLYALYNYHQSVESNDSKKLDELAGSKHELIADISRYSSQVLASKSSESTYYKELSLVEDAYLALKAGKSELAKEKLEWIDARSPAASIAELLKHYTIKGK